MMDRTEPKPKPPLQERAIEMVFKHGPFAVLAAVLLWFLLGNLKDSNANLVHTQQDTLNELRTHANESMWLMRQICINSAVQAGTPRELCDSPRSEKPR